MDPSVGCTSLIARKLKCLVLIPRPSKMFLLFIVHFSKHLPSQSESTQCHIRTEISLYLMWSSWIQSCVLTLHHWSWLRDNMSECCIELTHSWEQTGHHCRICEFESSFTRRVHSMIDSQSRWITAPRLTPCWSEECIIFAEDWIIIDQFITRWSSGSLRCNEYNKSRTEISCFLEKGLSQSSILAKGRIQSNHQMIT